MLLEHMSAGSRKLAVAKKNSLERKTLVVPESLQFGKEGLGCLSIQPYLSGIFLLPMRPASTCRFLGSRCGERGHKKATEKGSKGFRHELC